MQSGGGSKVAPRPLCPCSGSSWQPGTSTTGPSRTARTRYRCAAYWGVNALGARQEVSINGHRAPTGCGVPSRTCASVVGDRRPAERADTYDMLVRAWMFVFLWCCVLPVRYCDPSSSEGGRKYYLSHIGRAPSSGRNRLLSTDGGACQSHAVKLSKKCKDRPVHSSILKAELWHNFSNTGSARCAWSLGDHHAVE